MSFNLTATTANVAGAPDSVRIEILRWSTDEERGQINVGVESEDAAPRLERRLARGAGKQGKAAAKVRGAGRRTPQPAAIPRSRPCARSARRRRPPSAIYGRRKCRIRASLCGQD